MKESKRALRRWQEKCKLEKRIKIWVPVNQTQYFGDVKITSAEMRDKIRKGECWTFLKWTSTPCSCSLCAYYKYERIQKCKINKKIWDDIQEDLAS